MLSDDGEVGGGPPILLRGRIVGAGPEIGGEIADGIVELGGAHIRWAGPAARYPGRLPLPPSGDSILLPGLIDLHCHGGAGAGFPDTDAAGARHAVAHHRAHGTTGLLGSLVSAPAADLLRQAAVLADLVERAELLGIHLEGPFLSRARCGAQDPGAIIPGDPELFERICLAARGTVRSMTIAPETANFTALLAAMRAHGVLPSLGHTDADAATTSARIAEAGAPLTATHLFNGMPPLHHRAPGPVAACLAAAGRGELVVELIADGVHLAPDTVAMVFDTVGPDRIALVSDAMAAAGMSDGDYRLGPLRVRVEQAVARVVTGEEAAGPIAGGTMRLLDVVRHTVLAAGVPLPDAVAAASRTPATVLGLDSERGVLAAGYRADVIVTDPTLRVRRVYHAGVRAETEGTAWKS